jgi:uncharacterized membrane protein
LLNPLALAIFASLTFSLSNFFARLAMRDSTPSTAVVVSVTANALALWILAAFLSPIRPIFSMKIWPFVLAGLFAPCLARSFLFRGYKTLGLARADVISGSMPLFSVLLAVLYIGERPSIQAVFGTVLIVFGIGLLSYRREASQTWARWEIVFPLLGALFFALRDVVSKVGLQQLPYPITGAVVTATVAGLVLNIPYLSPKKRAQVVLTRRSLLLLCIGGLFATAAYWSIFSALQGGMVSLVSPLVATFPLFSVLLSFLFLQSQEKVSWRVVSGGILVVGGASSILIS